MLSRRALMQRAAAGIAAVSLPLSAARAQVINQTARVIVPFPAGGSTDMLARIMADGLKGTYAPATIVENRVGGAGRIDPDNTFWLFGSPMAVWVVLQAEPENERAKSIWQQMLADAQNPHQLSWIPPETPQ